MVRTLWFRIISFLLFLIIVSLLAGYIATAFNYPSLFNATPSFFEYAVPLPFTWAFVHIFSMLVYGIPLLLLAMWPAKYIGYFRLFCGVTFALYLFELDNKIPFVLFFKIDAVMALLFSFFLAPPNRKNNPVLVLILKVASGIIGLVMAYFIYDAIIHRTPAIKNTTYSNGDFLLRSITVNNDFRQNMRFHVDVTRTMNSDDACTSAQQLANGLLNDYPFDKSFEKRIIVSYYPEEGLKEFHSAEIGEISLQDEDKDSSGNFSCYITFR